MRDLAVGVDVSTGPPGADPVSDAVHAERLGFDLVTLHGDHPPAAGRHTEPSLETWTGLTWVAARTQRVAVAPCVLSLPYRHPAVTAKMAETLQRLSGGRLVLTLGAGGDDRAARAFGLPERSPGDKVDALEEAIAVLRGLWDRPEVTHRGHHYRLDAARIEPRPDDPIPLWIGGFGPRMLELTGRTADGWLTTLHYVVMALGRPPEELYAIRARVRDAAHAAGRDPDQLTYGCNVMVSVTPVARDEPHRVVGPAEQVAERLTALVTAGFTLLNLWPAGDRAEQHDQREQLAADVLPAVRAGR